MGADSQKLGDLGRRHELSCTWFVKFLPLRGASEGIKLKNSIEAEWHKLMWVCMCVCVCVCLALPEIYEEPFRTPEGEWIFQILKNAFAQPPKFSTLERYLNHQQILLASGVDNKGNAAKCIHDGCFSGNPNPRHHFSLRGKAPHS